MDLVEPAIEFNPVDRPPPQRAMTMSPRCDQPKPLSCPRPNRRRADTGNRRWIDLFLVAIAVDHCPRHRLDHRTDAGGNRPPHEPVDERIFERFQRAPALDGIVQDGRVIVAA